MRPAVYAPKPSYPTFTDRIGGQGVKTIASNAEDPGSKSRPSQAYGLSVPRKTDELD